MTPVIVTVGVFVVLIGAIIWAQFQTIPPLENLDE